MGTCDHVISKKIEVYAYTDSFLGGKIYFKDESQLLSHVKEHLDCLDPAIAITITKEEMYDTEYGQLREFDGY
jgi:hypothetical protein